MPGSPHISSRNALLGWRRRLGRWRARAWAALFVAAAAGIAGVQAGTITISQSGQVFSTAKLTLAAGDKVVFLNDDEVRHNIRILDSDDGMTDVGVQNPNQQLVYTFDKSGKFRVRCGIHPSMKLSVTVK